ncbi:MAG TPA: hypothetical protein VNO30_05405 [Kofleriaceae bacterium]|nr:hypothetical protein [Kofleriaceae bacterium]
MSESNHKRQWRNLLLNKSYQLRFTLVMVGLSTALMVGLGIWVMRVADETTEVSKASVMGTPCPQIPDMAAAAPPSAEPAPEGPQVPMKLEEPAPAPAPAGSAAPAPAGSGAGVATNAGSGAEPAAGDEAGEGRRKIVVSLEPMEVQQEPKLPPDYAAMVVKHWTCRLKIDAAKRSLERGHDRILWVMIGTGLLLVLGLAAYGIKMTHKVAGPLFKVSLYLKKMRDGRFDKVYNLRKGDQLLDFYEHFRQAHAGVVKMQQADIERVRSVIAAAEAAGAGDEPAVRELRDLLARKEKSIE